MTYEQEDQDFIAELLGPGGFYGLTDLAQSHIDSQDSAPPLDAMSYSRARPHVYGHLPDSTRDYDEETSKNHNDYRSAMANASAHENATLIDEFLAPNATVGAQLNRGSIAGVAPGELSNDVQETGLFQDAGNDEFANLTDEFASSLGSSIYRNDLASPSSSFGYHPQQLESLDTSHLQQYLSTSLRSPSNSFRSGNYLSSSLRGQLNPRQSSVSSVGGGTPVDSVLAGSNGLTQEEKLRRRREFHNAVERRRRELIKQKIKELGKLIPPSLLNFDDQGREVKANKGVILTRSLDYLDYLMQVLEVQDRKKKQLLKKIQDLEALKKSTSAKRVAAVSGARSDPRVKIEASNSPEQIIDTRIIPFTGESSATPSTVHDDLQQFLSGDLIEAEDNAKLMFGDTSRTVGTAADYLLDFER
ncbi:LAMI_0A07316g1_1 [Lachancea mirantina]|uniref:LAMI_0A07316g1_1 n=1 Tax=Lachancea mirantina TaxID=1230905 RepID=A0A1G4IQV8_9SACH|nr:LAMI_0A07316g1_1 [Lachancea mirantina]